MSLENQNGPTREDAIEQGRKDALANHKAEQEESTFANTDTREEVLEDARETAKFNTEADRENQPEAVEHDYTNDTSKEAKVATAKAQLDPNGDDPIKASEIEKSATNASMETGNKTAVSNKEAAERAKNSGQAEEDSPRSLAGEGATPAHNATTDKVSEGSTSNRQEVRDAEERAGRRPFNKKSENKNS